MMLIGLLGGMSWESTATYYREMNLATNRALGGLHSARILMHSVDFERIQKLQHEGKWGECARILVDAARSLKAGGASFLVSVPAGAFLPAASSGTSASCPFPF